MLTTSCVVGAWVRLGETVIGRIDYEVQRWSKISSNSIFSKFSIIISCDRTIMSSLTKDTFHISSGGTWRKTIFPLMLPGLNFGGLTHILSLSSSHKVELNRIRTAGFLLILFTLYCCNCNCNFWYSGIIVAVLLLENFFLLSVIPWLRRIYNNNTRYNL